MQAQMKIWFVENEKKVFGEGPYQLLQNVKTYGSLRKAASEMNMSYSKAWSLIKLIEKELSIKLLDKSIGGHEGGGSKVTKEARELMVRYEEFSRRMMEELEIFNRSMINKKN